MTPPLITVDMLVLHLWQYILPPGAKTSGFGRRHGAFSLDDQSVGFRLAVLGEVEDGFAVARAEIEIAARADDFVFQRHRLRDDLAGRRDDSALADHIRPLLDAAF